MNINLFIFREIVDVESMGAPPINQLVKDIVFRCNNHSQPTVTCAARVAKAVKSYVMKQDCLRMLSPPYDSLVEYDEVDLDHENTPQDIDYEVLCSMYT